MVFVNQVINHALVPIIKLAQTGGFVRPGRKSYDPGKNQGFQLYIKNTWTYPVLPAILYTLLGKPNVASHYTHLENPSITSYTLHTRSVGLSAFCSVSEKLERMQHRRRSFVSVIYHS